MNTFMRLSATTVQATIAVVLFMLTQNSFSTLIQSYIHSTENAQRIGAVISTLLVLLVWQGSRKILERFNEALDQSSPRLWQWIDLASPSSRYVAIALVAGLSLFLELVLIRWQGSLFPVFALYKNFTMLACFFGLGIGYAMSRFPVLLLPATLPLLAFTLLTLTLLHYGSSPDMLSLLSVVPVHEESAIFGTLLVEEWSLTSFAYTIPVYILLAVTFVLNALVLLPLGQFCGAMMERGTSLVSYGYNLLGSLGGVILLFALSAMLAGPVIWFALIIGLLLFYLLPAIPAFRAGLFYGVVTLLILGWPTAPLVQNIYSPYQLIQKVTKHDGLMQILAAGSYYQGVYDLSLNNTRRNTDPMLNKLVGYYELPYHTATTLKSVAIVGAGSGNDVAAALRSGAEKVDAVEIDPIILALGKDSHPEHPYDDKRVNPVINDARTFFRNTGNQYDVIVYGVLDSHALLSHGSNVRVDSFVYTQQGLQDAFDHLKQGGLMSVSFALVSSHMGDKIYHMLRTMNGAGSPQVLSSNYNTSGVGNAIGITTFMVVKGGQPKLPQDFIKAHHMVNQTEHYAGASAEHLDIPTDDWPFFYMDAKTYPASYVASLIMILALSVFMVRKMLPAQTWQSSLFPFFFLGGGFMLVETKAITELGLLFGNTWQVVGITIIAVLIMAYCANLLASRLSQRFVIPAYIGLLVMIGLGYFAAIHGGLPHTGLGVKLGMIVLLTSPLLFSGIIFSTLLKNTADISSAMAYNLIGAMLGGLLEYNSMQFGFSSLYIIGFVLYALALLTSFRLLKAQ